MDEGTLCFYIALMLFAFMFVVIFACMIIKFMDKPHDDHQQYKKRGKIELEVVDPDEIEQGIDIRKFW